MLKVQLQSKLELPRIKCSRGAAEVSTVVGALVEQSHIVDERRGGSFIESIEQVESFRDEFQPQCSPNGTSFASRMSSYTKRCVMPELRGRFPLENCPLEIKGTQPAVPGTHNIPSDRTARAICLV